MRISSELPSNISTIVNSIFFGALKNISILKKECEQYNVTHYSRTFSIEPGGFDKILNENLRTVE